MPMTLVLVFGISVAMAPNPAEYEADRAITGGHDAEAKVPKCGRWAAV
jgi:hypothetical protein